MSDFFGAVALFYRDLWRRFSADVRRVYWVTRWRLRRLRRTKMDLSVERAGSRELFLSLLSEENRRRFEVDGLIYIEGSGGGLYRMYRGIASNVRQVSGGYLKGWCAYPKGFEHVSAGSEDAQFTSMIAQMLLIQTNESEYQRIAY